MTPAPTRVPARALDEPRLRWALSGTVVLVLGTARGALWSLLLGEVSGQVALAFWTVPGVAMVLGWLVSGALVLAAALWVSPLAGDDVRRSIGWWAALVALDAIWRLVLVPMDLLWVEPYLGPAVGALAVCAVLASRRSPLRSYLGSALTAGLVLTLLTWTRGAPGFSVFFAGRHRMLAESIFNAAVLLAVAAGCLVGERIGRVRRVALT
ncbi:hypothetical protein [Olsenella uli]|uniref:hypothetical protein n=1 Tax=Olsenella uli TaxID=133926 RepID=UPI00325FAF5C